MMALLRADSLLENKEECTLLKPYQQAPSLHFLNRSYPEFLKIKAQCLKLSAPTMNLPFSSVQTLQKTQGWDLPAESL